MPTVERMTITLPDSLVREIDRWEKNRSKFVAEAVRREIERRQHIELRRSLENPPPESFELADQRLDDLVWGLPAEDASELFDANAGRAVQWVPGEGWVEAPSSYESLIRR